MFRPILLAAFLCLVIAPALLAQGTLAPPGSPAPTLKTLTQIEPRTIINSTNTPGDATNSFIINQSGSYYLSGNLTGASGKNGISIQADDVTLDLNGYSLVGVAGSLTGIAVVVPQSGLVVSNGTVRGWGAAGIYLPVVAIQSTGGSFANLHLRANGDVGLHTGLGAVVRDCVAEANASSGIEVGRGSTIERCTALGNAAEGFMTYYTTSNSSGVIGPVTFNGCIATANGGAGFLVDSSTVTGCVASYNSGSGISATRSALAHCSAVSNAGTEGIGIGSESIMTNCTASSNTGNYGLYLNFHSTAVHCTATNNGTVGMRTGNNCTVIGCTVTTNSGSGIVLGNGSNIRDCTTNENVGPGITAAGNCLIRDCVANENTGVNGVGIKTTAVNNRIEGNHCVGNANYGIQSFSATADYIMRNTCTGNAGAVTGFSTANYSPKAGQNFGVLSGVNDAGVSPWANF